MKRQRRPGQSKMTMGCSIHTHPKNSRPSTQQPDLVLAKALSCHAAGNLREAEALCRQILFVAPRCPHAFHLLGAIALDTGRCEAGLELIDKAISINPLTAAFHNSRGIALERGLRFQSALESYDRAILLNRHFVEAYNNRGNALQKLRQYEAALESYDRAILIRPDFATAYSNRGNALRELGHYRLALENFDTAITLDPEFAEVHNNRGTVLEALGSYDAAIRSYDRAISLRPTLAAAHNNRGAALLATHLYSEALESFDRAIALKPNSAEAHSNRGNALNIIHDHLSALESFSRAILISPGLAKAYDGRASALQALHRYQDALVDCDQATSLSPAVAWFHCNRGNTLLALRQHEDALKSFEKASLLDPAIQHLPGVILHLKQFSGDWTNILTERRDVEARIMGGEHAASPFVVLGTSDSPSVQHKAAAMYSQGRYPSSGDAPAIHKRSRRDSIHLGYCSPDFREHAVSHLVAELLELHDRSRFKIVGFSFGQKISGAWTTRLSAAVDQVVDIDSLSDARVVDISREMEIDIAIDLTGYTEGHRAGIFSRRAAPIQVNYLGYPGTMGAEYMDYLIADNVVIPECNLGHFSEKIVYMPDCFQANDSRRLISNLSFTRSGVGLPETGFVYSCFNNNYKVSPESFDIWMRVLGRVEGSVLWLLEGSPRFMDNLRGEAALRGVSPERLVFARPLPLSEHTARQKLADLFLDTLPFNAGATASSALWAGLPVLTCMGRGFSSRMAASLLRAAHLPELVTTTQQEYEELAVELGLMPRRVEEIKERLERNKLSAPLFDTAAFARNLEAAYAAMYDRHLAGLPPEHLYLGKV